MKVYDYNKGIDILKIISMMGVICLHVLGHGGLIENASFFTFEFIELHTLHSIAICAVDIFVILSGYNLVRRRFSISRVLLLWLEVCFYSVAVYLIVCLINCQSIEPIRIIKSLLPIKTRAYWFFTQYFALSLLIPFLNRFVNNLEKRVYLRLIMLCLILFCIIAKTGSDDLFFAQAGYSLIWFVFLYLCGAYIKIYGINLPRNLMVILVIISTLIILISQTSHIDFSYSP